MKGPESVNGVVAPAARSRKRKAFLYIFNSVTAIIAITVIFIVNTTGVVRTVQTLLGSSDTPRSYGYHSFNMPFLLREAVVSGPSVQNRITTLLDAGYHVAYLEKDTTDATQFQPNSCANIVNATTERIYAPNYVSFLMKNMMVEYGMAATVTDNSAIAVVDCSFEGRLAQDTTAFKAYLLERHLKWVVTFQLQTIMANIPARRDTMPTGTVTITNMTLASLQVAPTIPSGDTLAGLSSSEVAIHRMFSSRGFPFNTAAFDEVYINSTTSTGAWNTYVLSTELEMILQGYGGMYRGSQNEQANYNTFVWQLSPNPLDPIHYFNYEGVGRIKNSWAWGQALVSGFLSFTIITSTIMACIISKNIHTATGVWWIPDISPSVGSGIGFRGVLTILAWWIDGWWALQEWSYNQGNARSHLLTMYVLTDSIKSDCLSLFLAGAALIATNFRLRVNPAIPVIVYMIVYSQREAIVAGLGFILTRANDELMANQMLNVVPSDSSGLDMWMWHEKLDFNATIVFNEMTWLYIALIVFALYCAMNRFYTVRFTDHLVEAAHTRGTMTADTGGTGATTGKSGSTENATCFESSTGEYLRHKYGLMSYHENYLFIKGMKYASPSGIWTSGWVVVDNRFLFRTDDIMKVFFNILLCHDIFRAHCHVITESKVDKTVIRVFRKDISIKQLFTLSLRPLS
ncbi:hypothetical protein SDRG_09701 [Saprolegnia diclina VS20]|uniref:Transmembrane protein n=1 Tax=Saprolegnia diclina (strain VS20) TaxID=1156394 RepID=T0QGH0_SAPDV|nr:hypothetical protein SDRG_09701 [Saprolegnia diclina VS20]EQC32730.1 hypothetical protein SDRG_09701 [Saprolegnia diclina VS20]|eukprot:XP_008613874.1 hypothetical protein SDRG_09701 [Saprolegnia diclina VS20]